MRTLLLLLTLVSASVAAATMPLGELVDIHGIRGNQLTGYSLVVGLDGTGDRNQVKFTSQSLNNLLRQHGVQLPAKVDPKVKNVAAVALSATLPPLYARGQTINVTVSSIGDARSLRGGMLLLTELRGVNGEVYALAQGNVVVGGVSVRGEDGSSVTVNTPTVGLVPNGAIVEREIPSDFQRNNTVILNLKRPGFTLADTISRALNLKFGANTASAASATQVTVAAPADPAARVAFMSVLETLPIETTRPPARIIFNARTGTVILGEGIRVRPVAVAHGNLTLTIREQTNVTPAAPFTEAESVITPASDVSVDRGSGQLTLLEGGETLGSIVASLNGMGAAADDIMGILQALHAAGALDAELIVI
ncbi:flagellar basal body P-ring protein FlgI [Pantoea sp. A4]|uniref:flagellar basal body P-ring protein FlgI n=1 Tax=Pantoea sp. A4 TaxID=1225184 RepID=UPI0003607AA6|nr:flagellar basal body P-ring protein FlgI [Pantoea sp. A4]